MPDRMRGVRLMPDSSALCVTLELWAYVCWYYLLLLLWIYLSFFSLFNELYSRDTSLATRLSKMIPLESM